jgi:hypothetical protein
VSWQLAVYQWFPYRWGALPAEGGEEDNGRLHHNVLQVMADDKYDDRDDGHVCDHGWALIMVGRLVVAGGGSSADRACQAAILRGYLEDEVNTHR